MRQADRVTDRQNDSMTVWQNSRAAKETALVFLEIFRQADRQKDRLKDRQTDGHIYFI